MTFDYIADIGKMPSRYPLQIRVNRFWIAINLTNNDVMHKDLILIDAKGDDIWVKIPYSLIHRFSHVLADQKVCTVRHFKVINASSVYRPIPNKADIEFMATTTVEAIDNVESIPQYKFYFLKASEIASKLDDRKQLSGQMKTILM
ncbi:hypothetical protein LINGRAHAP2_LOCUS32549 [Linum grandiflorum]